MKTKVLMVELPYPYGKPLIYRGGATFVVGAQFLEAGCDVRILDLNIYPLETAYAQECLMQTDIIGVSITGSPYIPVAIDFCRDIHHFDKQVMIGGQVVTYINREHFKKMFRGTHAVQVITSADVPIGILEKTLPSPYEVDIVGVWELLDEKTRSLYIHHEMSLFISQGCLYNCAFCAAEKAMVEQFRNKDMLTKELRYICERAIDYGITQIEVYASSLDFFQSVLKHKEKARIIEILKIMISIQNEYGVRFKMRCLCTMKSFLAADRHIPEFDTLVQQSGLWCVGFGVDGSDPSVWKSQNKTQNKLSEITQALDVAQGIGIRSEVLMVLGFSSDTLYSMGLNVIHAFKYVLHWQNIVLRPYLAKEYVPGNDLWNEYASNRFVKKPRMFQHLDFCAFGSRETHPRWIHRWYSNVAYLIIIVCFAPFGKCATSPLLPVGNNIFSRWVASIFNRMMPFDR